MAGAIPVVKGKGLTVVGNWERLIDECQEVSDKMRVRGEHSSSIKLVLETSPDAWTRRKQDLFVKMDVLAAGANAPIEVLLNLWEMQVRRRVVASLLPSVAKRLNEHIQYGPFGRTRTISGLAGRSSIAHSLLLTLFHLR